MHALFSINARVGKILTRILGYIALIGTFGSITLFICGIIGKRNEMYYKNKIKLFISLKKILKVSVNQKINL